MFYPPHLPHQVLKLFNLPPTEDEKSESNAITSYRVQIIVKKVVHKSLIYCFALYFCCFYILLFSKSFDSHYKM